MKKLIYSILLLSLSTGLDAQVPEVKIGQQLMIQKDDDIIFAGHDESNFYIIRTEEAKKNTLGYFESYSRTDLKKNSSKQLSVPTTDADEFKIHNIKFSVDKMYLFYSFFSRSDKKRHVCVTNFDKKGQTDKKFTDLTQCDKNDDATIIIDDEAGRILVITEGQESGSGDFQWTSFLVLKDDLTKLNEVKEFKIDNHNIQVNYTQFDLKGNLYMYCGIKKTSLTNNYEMIFALMNTEGKITSINFPQTKSKNNYYNSNFYRDNNGKVYFVSQRGNYSGLIIHDFPAGTLTGIKSDDIDYQSPLPGEKHKDGKADIYENMYIYDVKQNDDGSTRIVLHSNRSGGGAWYSQCTAQIVLDKDLKWKSATFIPKNQFHGGTGGLAKRSNFEGDIMLLDKDNTFFFYNDLPGNYSATDMKSLKKITASNAYKGDVIPSYAIIDQSGKMERKPLMTLPSGAKTSTLRPSTSYVINDQGKPQTEAYALLETDEKLSFVRISIK